jgi:hypothetical protein
VCGFGRPPSSLLHCLSRVFEPHGQPQTSKRSSKPCNPQFPDSHVSLFKQCTNCRNAVLMNFSVSVTVEHSDNLMGGAFGSQ